MADSVATAQNLTIAEGKNLTVRNVMQLLSTDGAVVDFGAGGTVSYGGGGGTPGGATTQLQYNNAGAFGGISGATSNGTVLTLVAPVLGAATGTSLALGGASLLGNILAVTGSASISANLVVVSSFSSTGSSRFQGDKSTIGYINNGFATYSSGVYAFCSGADALTGVDTGISRISAGVIGIGTGAQGSVAGSLSMTGLKAIGNIDFTALPSSDPGVPGRLYKTAGTVMVSL